MSEAEREAERRYPLMSRGDDAQAYRREGFITGADWRSSHAVSQFDTRTLTQLIWTEIDNPALRYREVIRAADAVLAALSTQPAAGEVERPEIVCLCGSTRFYDAFQEANYDLTMAGKIVLSVGFYPHAKAKHGHGEGVGHDSAEKVALDELHKRKIDLADWVLVLNIDGYIGDSTRSEITYALTHGKRVEYLVGVAAEQPTELAELFPGTLAALDRLSIRPEVQS